MRRTILCTICDESMYDGKEVMRHYASKENEFAIMRNLSELMEIEIPLGFLE